MWPRNDSGVGSGAAPARGRRGWAAAEGFWEGTTRATGEVPGPEHGAGVFILLPHLHAIGKELFQGAASSSRGAESGAGIAVAVSLRVAPLL